MSRVQAASLVILAMTADIREPGVNAGVGPSTLPLIVNLCESVVQGRERMGATVPQNSVFP